MPRQDEWLPAPPRMLNGNLKVIAAAIPVVAFALGGVKFIYEGEIRTAQHAEQLLSQAERLSSVESQSDANTESRVALTTRVTLLEKEIERLERRLERRKESER